MVDKAKFAADVLPMEAPGFTRELLEANHKSKNGIIR